MQPRIAVKSNKLIQFAPELYSVTCFLLNDNVTVEVNACGAAATPATKVGDVAVGARELSPMTVVLSDSNLKGSPAMVFRTRLLGLLWNGVVTWQGRRGIWRITWLGGNRDVHGNCLQELKQSNFGDG